MIAYSVLTDGRHLPVSIWEMRLGDRPTLRARLRRLTPRLRPLRADTPADLANRHRHRGTPLASMVREGRGRA